MIRYTTPTITLYVRHIDLIDEHEVYVTLKQGSVKLTKEDADVTIADGTMTIVVTLSQTETGQFKANLPVQVQVNWIDSSGIRGATKIATINTFENLLDEVITYGD